MSYTTYISVDNAHHEIFHAKVGKGGITSARPLELLTTTPSGPADINA